MLGGTKPVNFSFFPLLLPPPIPSLFSTPWRERCTHLPPIQRSISTPVVEVPPPSIVHFYRYLEIKLRRQPFEFLWIDSIKWWTIGWIEIVRRNTKGIWCLDIATMYWEIIFEVKLIRVNRVSLGERERERNYLVFFSENRVKLYRKNCKCE